MPDHDPIPTDPVGPEARRDRPTVNTVIVICTCAAPVPLDWPYWQSIGGFTCARCGGWHG